MLEVARFFFRSGGGVLLGILGGGVPPGSPNPDPISDQKLCSIPVFIPGGGHQTQHYMFTYSRNYVIIAGIKRRKPKHIPDSRPKWASSILVFRPKLRKIHTLRGMYVSILIDESSSLWNISRENFFQVLRKPCRHSRGILVVSCEKWRWAAPPVEGQRDFFVKQSSVAK